MSVFVQTCTISFMVKQSEYYGDYLKFSFHQKNAGSYINATFYSYDSMASWSIERLAEFGIDMGK